MTEVASQTLDSVGRELGVTLGDARSALEIYVEQTENPAPLEKCMADLHQVQAVLRVLEIYGASLLAEEMEQVASYLLATVGERKSQAESLDALMRAMVQLPTYLERVLAGGRDLALVLLPLLNDLRAVRGSALLSEGTLLLLNLKSDRQAQPLAPPVDEPATSMEQWSRKLRGRFQVGLIGWIRGERIDQNLETMASVAQKLEQLASEQPVFQLWWVVGAVIEALQEAGLEGGVSIKRLLGLADREIKRLYDQGEARYAQSPPVELLNNLLYYVGRAESSGPRVSAVRSSFRLNDLLPVDETIEQERENLSAPSVKLMQTVAAAIREDLSKVKDVLDIFARRGAGQPKELAPQADLLSKIGDTLGVLGLGDLRANVQSETEKLNKIIRGELQADETVLVGIAATLIGVEDRLDDRLIGMILPRQGTEAVSGEEAEFKHVESAVLRECIFNLARVKEAVTQNVGGTLDASGLDSWPDLLRGLQAGLLMLGKSGAVEIVELIAAQLKRVMQPGGGAMQPNSLDRLADGIVSLEYYMETMQAGRGDPAYMLDNARASLAAIELDPVVQVPTVAPVDVAHYERTVHLDAGTAAHSLTAPNVSPPTLAQTPAKVLDLVDPELVTLFIDEAREELAKIEQTFPEWDHNPLEHEALVTVRRSFHTLKGSGRMVGARDLGEFAWALENLLNRLLDNTFTRTPLILTTLRDGIAALPGLIDQLETGQAPGGDSTGIAARAHALAAGRPIPPREAETAGSPAEPIPTSAPAEAAGSADAGDTEPDRVLHEIYARETRTHVATVRTYLDRERQAPPPHDLPEDVYRACHTLSGSSKMAEARHGIRLAQPLDHWLRKVFDSGLGLTDAELSLLGDCMTAMETVAANLDERTSYFLDQDALLTRIARAEADIDHRIVAAALLADQTGPHVVRPERAVEPAAEPAHDADFDPDVASIFVEEATELLEALQAALGDWRDAPSDSAKLDSLKRPLHTLKGGARMAGISAMGDLSHELETLVNELEMGTLSSDERAFGVVQQSLDELSRMREAVASGSPATSAAPAIARIKALLEPQAESPPAPAQVVDVIDVVEAAADAPPEASEADTFVDFDVAPALVEVAAEPEVATPAAAPNEATVKDSTEAPVEADQPQPALPVPPGREPVVTTERAEMARVDADLLDQLLNNSGEVSIARSRLEQQLGSIEFNLGELSRTVTRLKDQLRNLEIETETQILHRHEEESTNRGDFDPLELDRYSSIQQFSRALAETASDVASIQQLLETLTQEAQNLLQAQSRTITELQNGLMRTRMVPFQRHVQRLSRIVRQAAADTGRRAELSVEGASGELDRQVLERMLPPFEHILRNAVVHGIETPDQRVERGKSPIGQIRLEMTREGAEVSVQISDDGAGMNLHAIRAKGIDLGLITADQHLSDEDAMQLVLEPGFSTASSVTQQAGRGVGMDIVSNEIKKLGGALHMETNEGRGTRFTIRLPFTLAISHALVIRTGEEFYALPLPTVEGVLRLSKAEVANHIGGETPTFDYGGQKYRFQHLAAFVGLEPSPLPENDLTIPVVLVRAGEHSTGLIADELIGSREIVVKSVGPQIAAIRGISGATILGDGRIVVILDIGALLRAEWRGRAAPVPRERADKRAVALVVDDSITMRRVTQRLLERNGMRVLTARDGMDAVSMLQEMVPDIILLDVEMPRMDGYEVAAQVRNDPRLKDVPIIMITSRTGEKHRARAIELGVDDYLGKPYQEAQLLDSIAPLLERKRARQRATDGDTDG